MPEKSEISLLSKWNEHKLDVLMIFSFLFLILSVATVSAERLPTVGGDSDTWGTILNEYLSKLAGENATDLNQTMVNGTNIYGSSINTTHIIDGTITDADISDTTNLTLGEKITFALGEIIDNIVDGWIRLTGNVNVTSNLNVMGDVNFTGLIYGNGSQLTGISGGIWTNVSGTATYEDNVNVTGNLTVDTNTLFVNSNTDQVGIGTATPSQVLDVVGGIQLGSTSSDEAGVIRWTGSAFQAFNGTVWNDFASNGSGTSDHGSLSGLTDDDHTQYALIQTATSATARAINDDSLRERIIFPDSSTTDFTGDLSICVRTNITGSGQNDGLVAKDNNFNFGRDSGNGWIFSRNNGTSDSVLGNVVPTDIEIQACVTHNATSGNVTFYVDGSTAGSGIINHGGQDTTGTLFIGETDVSLINYNVELIDHVCIDGTVWNATTISNIQNNGCVSNPSFYAPILGTHPEPDLGSNKLVGKVESAFTVSGSLNDRISRELAEKDTFELSDRLLAAQLGTSIYLGTPRFPFTTAGLLAAINQSRLTKETIKLPAGDLLVSASDAPIDISGVCIDGLGKGITKILGDNLAEPILHDNGNTILCLRDLTVDNQNKSIVGGVGLKLENGDASLIENVHFRKVEKGVLLTASGGDSTLYNVFKFVSCFDVSVCHDLNDTFVIDNKFYDSRVNTAEVGFNVTGKMNTFYSANCEVQVGSGICFDINSQGNSFYETYSEGFDTAFDIANDTEGTKIFGGKNACNVVFGNTAAQEKSIVLTGPCATGSGKAWGAVADIHANSYVLGASASGNKITSSNLASSVCVGSGNFCFVNSDGTAKVTPQVNSISIDDNDNKVFITIEEATESGGTAVLGGGNSDTSVINLVNIFTTNETGNANPDRFAVEFVNASSGPITRGILAPNTIGAGRIFSIKKIDSSSNIVTISTNIDGSNCQLIDQYDSVTVIYDGSIFHRLSGRGRGCNNDAPTYSALTITNQTLLATQTGNVGINTTNPDNFTLEIAGSIGPETNNTYDLGSGDLRWATVYTVSLDQLPEKRIYH